MEEEGVEAFLEAPLSENDHQALLDMLPGSPGPQVQRERKELAPSPSSHFQVSFPEMWRHGARVVGRFWLGGGENTVGMSTNNFGDKHKSWNFG